MCEAAGLVEEVRAELATTGTRPHTERSPASPPSPQGAPGGRLAAGGLSNRDIAQALDVTPKTVKVHLSNSHRKLGIRSG